MNVWNLRLKALHDFDLDRIRMAAGVGPLTPIDDLVDAVSQLTQRAIVDEGQLRMLTERLDQLREAAGVELDTHIDAVIDVIARATRCAPSRLVREFHEKFGLPAEGDEPPFVLNELRARLIREETAEAVVEIERGTDKAAMAKELADAVYVIYGTALTFGINLDEALAQVHRSNMTKQALDWDGKVTKGPDYVEPDMSSAILPPRLNESIDASRAMNRDEITMGQIRRGVNPGPADSAGVVSP